MAGDCRIHPTSAQFARLAIRQPGSRSRPAKLGTCGLHAHRIVVRGGPTVRAAGGGARLCDHDLPRRSAISHMVCRSSGCSDPRGSGEVVRIGTCLRRSDRCGDLLGYLRGATRFSMARFGAWGHRLGYRQRTSAAPYEERPLDSRAVQADCLAGTGHLALGVKLRHLSLRPRMSQKARHRGTLKPDDTGLVRQPARQRGCMSRRRASPLRDDALGVVRLARRS